MIRQDPVALRTQVDADLAQAGLELLTSATEWPPHAVGYTVLAPAIRSLAHYQERFGRRPSVWYWHRNSYFLGERADFSTGPSGETPPPPCGA